MYFNTESISYNVNIQPDIMQNYWKNMRENHNILKWPLKFFGFFLFYFIIIILLLKINWARSKRVQPNSVMIGQLAVQQTIFLGLNWTRPNHLG